MTVEAFKLTIKQIKEQLKNVPLSSQLWEQLQNDPRRGVQQLVQRQQKILQKQYQQQQDFERRLQFERPFWNRNQLVAGIDEVGRGPLAGPVVKAAVVLPADIKLWQINDSKQLTAAKRRQLYEQILT
ncbi:ribonuclease HII, partial [Lactobacillus sp. XV13L]|nr:ribonuclease HII [Lactobacillus sp. XV13L]